MPHSKEVKDEKKESKSTSMERYIISLLIAALSAVLWYLLLDTRQDLTALRDLVYANNIKITSMEIQLQNVIFDVKELKEWKFELRRFPRS